MPSVETRTSVPGRLHTIAQNVATDCQNGIAKTNTHNQQDHQDEWRQQERGNPQQKQRQPQPEIRPVRVVQVNDGNIRSHLMASSSLIASEAVISPFLSRSRTSERDGIGLVSINCSSPEIRLSRALIVG